MDLREIITEIGKTIPGQFEMQRDGSARIEAARKAAESAGYRFEVKLMERSV